MSRWGWMRRSLRDLCLYMQRQRVHHTKETFEMEYRQFLHVHGIEAEERYVFG